MFGLKHCLIFALIVFYTETVAQQTVFIWGDNDQSQMGDGILDETGDGPGWNTPEPMSCYDDWKSISLGDFNFQGIRQNGTLWTWGMGRVLGTAQEFDFGAFKLVTVATQIGIDTDWASTSTTGNNTLGLKTDGSLWVWGTNSSGNLGDGTTTSVPSPKRIGADANWATAQTGDSRSYGIKKDGTLWAWGDNTNGELGIGSTSAPVVTPKLISTDSDWEILLRGQLAFCTAAIKKDGSLWIWGSNISGVLGLGLTNATGLDRVTSPRRVGTGNDWKAISSAAETIVALKKDGSLWSWGSNQYKLLGDGGSDRNVPQRVGTDNDWATVSVGGTIALATKTDGSLWMWGSFAYASFSSAVPVRIGTDTGWNAVAAGFRSAAALKDIPFNPVPVPVDLGADVHSCQSSALLTSSITDAAVYKWTTPNSTIKGTSTWTADDDGTYKLTITKSGCRSTDEIEVILNNTAQGTFSISGTPIDTCPGFFDQSQPLTFDNETGMTGNFTWTFGNGITASTENATYVYPQPGHYTVELIGECSLHVTKEIDVLPLLVLESDMGLCKPTVTMNSNVPAANQYSWRGPNGASATTPTFTVSESGTYTLSATQAGCTQTNTILITVNGSSAGAGSITITTAGISLDDDATILTGVPITLTSTGDPSDEYTWAFGNSETSDDAQVEYVYNEPGTYRITLTGKNEAGCPEITEKNIHVENIVITNAISPNGDGKNDQLRITPVPYEMELIVTDQQGKTVYTAAPYQGDFTGNQLEDGIYYYELRMRSIDKSYKGFVHIIR